MTEPTGDLPQQSAATRRFRLGVPRAFRVGPDGRRVAFLRSAGGRDPVGSLWVAEDIDGTLVERCLVDARLLADGSADLPAAERARRERMRETTSGITAFTADAQLVRAVFALDGVPYLVELDAQRPGAVSLPHPGPVVDPQLSPDGRWASFVSERAVYVVPTDGGSEPRSLCEPDGPDDAWGLVDFIAAEELGRFRGLWWLPSSDALLVEHVDESDVAVRWISDPAHPEREPHPHRYPVAGTANPVARLFRVDLDGRRAEVAWDHDVYPYLATVQAHDERAAIISVLSRDQQRQLILRLPTGSAEASVVKERVTEPWVTVVPGVPCLHADGRLLEVIVDVATDSHRLIADDVPLSPSDLNVSALVDASAEGLLFTGTSEPSEQHVYRIGVDGAVVPITEGASVNSVAGRADALVLVTTDSVEPVVRVRAQLPLTSGAIVSLAERPCVDPVVAFHRVGERGIPAAVLWPSGHVQGSGPLPVVMAPYGGPHGTRVTRSALAFATDQWLADQGFAVVVVDGRGTPGLRPSWEFAVHRDLTSVVLEDQVSALRGLAADHPDLDLTRVGITGWSFGGFLAALAVLERPDVFHAAVAGAPVTDWRLYDTAYTERYLGHPDEQPEVYEANSLLPRAAQLTRPLLLIHGLADDNVMSANTLQFSSALLAAGRPHAVLPLTGVTHMTPQEVVAENLLRLEVEFLTSHLT